MALAMNHEDLHLVDFAFEDHELFEQFVLLRVLEALLFYFPVLGVSLVFLCAEVELAVGENFGDQLVAGFGLPIVHSQLLLFRKVFGD